MAEARSEPGRVVVAPDERDIRLLPQIIHHPVAAGTPVPAVAADDQLVDRQIAHQADGDVDQLPDAAPPDQFVDDRRHELAAALGRRLMEHLGHQLAVLGGKNLHRPLQAVAGHQDADQLEEVAQGAQGEIPQLPGRARRLLEPLDHLAGVENKGEKLLEARRLHSAAEHPFQQRAQGPGGIVDHMPQLLVLAVNVADDVDRALGQRQDGGKPRDFRHGGVHIGKAPGQRAQQHQFPLAGFQQIGAEFVHSVKGAGCYLISPKGNPAKRAEARPFSNRGR